MTGDRWYSRSSRALWRRTSHRVLVNTPTGTTVELEGVSAVVWDALDERVSFAELAEDFAAAFEQPLASVQGDLQAVLTRLVELDAVVVEP
jgi:hypothetical protein